MQTSCHWGNSRIDGWNFFEDHTTDLGNWHCTIPFCEFQVYKEDFVAWLDSNQAIS